MERNAGRFLDGKKGGGGFKVGKGVREWRRDWVRNRWRKRDEFAFLAIWEIYFKGKFHQNFIMTTTFFSFLFSSLEVAQCGDFKRLAWAEAVEFLLWLIYDCQQWSREIMHVWSKKKKNTVTCNTNTHTHKYTLKISAGVMSSSRPNVLPFTKSLQSPQPEWHQLSLHFIWHPFFLFLFNFLPFTFLSSLNLPKNTHYTMLWPHHHQLPSWQRTPNPLRWVNAPPNTTLENVTS